jgi:hypothetical protein
MMAQVFPIFVGQPRSPGVYNRYVIAGPDRDHPDHVPPVCVRSVEDQLVAHLEQQGLGTPYRDCTSVADVLAQIMAFQGAFVDGPLPASLDTHVVPLVHRMVPSGRWARRGVHFPGGSIASRNFSVASASDSVASHHTPFPPAPPHASAHATATGGPDARGDNIPPPVAPPRPSTVLRSSAVTALDADEEV